MLNQLKIACGILICFLVSPCVVFADELSSQQLTSSMNVEIDITASSDSGVEIPAYYVKVENKYYLFMMASDSRQVSLTYPAVNGQSTTKSVSFATSDEIVLKDTQAGSVNVVFKQSKIPSLSIRLNGTTLDKIHQDKNVKWAGNSLAIDDPSGSYSLSSENVEIKGRGNSSWSVFDKKGYQIKFDKKTPVLGMEKAKKWVLIPNASDDSLLRNKIAYSLAQNLNMKYALDCKYVDLWIDGDYRGNYLISEKVEIGSNRVNLTDDSGILCEWDDAFYSDEDYWFKNDALDATFAVKETVNEDPEHIKQTMREFSSSLTEFANVLFKTPTNKLTIETLNKYIDVESFVQYYLINEFMLNEESVTTSWFWYKDGNSDVIHVGPAWDFDSSMNFYGSASEVYIYNRNIFWTFLQIPSVREYMKLYYSSHASEFKGAATTASTEAKKIASSAEMNYIRWDELGKVGKTGYKNHDTWEEAVQVTSEWLRNRVSGFYLKEMSASMYRLYNPNSGEHFYTASTEEKAHLASVGWTYEGVGWTSNVYSDIPVYRLYNPNAGDHHYTTSANERDMLTKAGWIYEGIGWYSDKYQRVPLYRQYNPNAIAGAHNFTSAVEEKNGLVNKYGWIDEGIGWYGL